MRFLKTLILSLLALGVFIIALVFALRNSDLATVDLYFWVHEDYSLSLWLFAAFALGALFGFLLFVTLWLRLKASQISTKRKLTAAQQEVALLKTPTLSE